eukprot:CAMPEP_0115829286 /NCGR_PEP_ID=MMETSP0287-20121206/1020_1 /TAXON_ID=412157 /ORGANISM="Chrysochromulina rotalis, Strain UIO044" /LENGTH=54 /DNA_ID=CAMNT_0003282547 /DNA_START=553 /DNA_END=714 /DNA_ORIENTATION=+
MAAEIMATAAACGSHRGLRCHGRTRGAKACRGASMVTQHGFLVEPSTTVRVVVL